MSLYLLRPRALPAWLGPLVKASDTPPGTRWITVHPNGPDEEGQPVPGGVSLAFTSVPSQAGSARGRRR